MDGGLIMATSKKRITLHPLKTNGEIDTSVNLYPKTFIDGIVDREGEPVDIQEKLIAGDNITIVGNIISATGGSSIEVPTYLSTDGDLGTLVPQIWEDKPTFAYLHIQFEEKGEEIDEKYFVHLGNDTFGTFRDSEDVKHKYEYRSYIIIPVECDVDEEEEGEGELYLDLEMRGLQSLVIAKVEGYDDVLWDTTELESLDEKDVQSIADDRISDAWNNWMKSYIDEHSGDVKSSQMTVSMIINPITNINGRELTSFVYTYTVIDGIYKGYIITDPNGNNLTEEDAQNYMEWMTGSRYLPVYNYEKPQNSIMVTADGTFLKPQYTAGAMFLYNISSPIDTTYKLTDVDVDIDDERITMPDEVFDHIMHFKPRALALSPEEGYLAYFHLIDSQENYARYMLSFSDDEELQIIILEMESDDKGQRKAEIYSYEVGGGEPDLQIASEQDIRNLFATKYNVSFAGSYCWIDPYASEVIEHESFYTNIIIQSGYKIDSATLLMGNTDVTSQYMSYSTTGGSVNIPDVTGDISITVNTSADLDNYVPFDVTISGMVLDSWPSNPYPKHSSYYSTVQLYDGYTVDNIKNALITMGGNDITNEVFDRTNLQINIPDVSDIVYMQLEAYFSVTKTLNNCYLSNDTGRLDYNSSWWTEVHPTDSEYTLTSCQVFMNGADITSQCVTMQSNYATINISMVTGDVEVIATAESGSFVDVTMYSGDVNVTETNPARKVAVNSIYNNQISWDEGNELTSYSIAMNGFDVDPSYINYDDKARQLTIHDLPMAYTLNINLYFQPAGKVNVTTYGPHYWISNSEAYKGKAYSTNVYLNDSDYYIDSAYIGMMQDGTEVNITDTAWDGTGRIINIDNVTGNIIISLTVTSNVFYTATVNLPSNITESNLDRSVRKGDNYQNTLTCPDSFTVYMIDESGNLMTSWTAWYNEKESWYQIDVSYSDINGNFTLTDTYTPITTHSITYNLDSGIENQNQVYSVNDGESFWLNLQASSFFTASVSITDGYYQQYEATEVNPSDFRIMTELTNIKGEVTVNAYFK